MTTETDRDQLRTYLYGMLDEEHRNFQRRISPIVDQLVRLESLSPRPQWVSDPSCIPGVLSIVGIKKAPAGEDRGQGGQETTTKNEPSV